MKIIHCADLHLESKINGLPAEKSKIRREEILRSFERLLDYAENEGVSVVIIAGDMFDTEKVSARTKSRVINCIETHSKIDFLYLPGNHDEDSFLSESEILPKNLKTFSDTWQSYEYGNLAISGIITDKLNEKTLYDTLILEKEKVNIVVMHGQIIGYSSDEKAENISLPLLREKNIDYLALGHIHYHDLKPLDNRGVYAYCGCLDGRGFDETGVKGFYLLEIEGENLSANFVEFSSRIFHEVTYFLEGEESFYEVKTRVLAKLKETCDSKDLVKVVLKGERAPDLFVDTQSLAAAIGEEFFFAKVYDKTTLKLTDDDFAADKSVRGEFVRVVLASELSEEEKTLVLTCGINALKGEEV